MIMSTLKEINRNYVNVRKCFFALLGTMFIGIGVAFNSLSLMGNDPVGIFYDGIRAILKLSPYQLGFVTYLVNGSILLFLWFKGRRYLNFGTILYLVFYGTFVNIGLSLFRTIAEKDFVFMKAFSSITGCILIYLGVALFIVTDIGLDPITALISVIRDKLKWNFGITKVAFDTTFVTFGALLGGKLGIVTIITMLTAGPVIEIITKKLLKVIKIWDKDEGVEVTQ
jgi:uncharacterized membrane protein YczE